MADKQIFELPDLTLTILNSGVDISFVAQVQGYSLDFQVPLEIMAQYLQSGYVIGITNGTSNPDPANGNNGDIYFKSDGKIYQKISGSWVVKATLPVQPAPIIRVLTVGQPVPYSFTLPSNFNGKYQMSVKIDRGGGLWENYPDAKVQDLLDLVTSGGVITDYFVNRVDLYGNESGGVNLDRMIFTFSKG